MKFLVFTLLVLNLQIPTGNSRYMFNVKAQTFESQNRKLDSAFLEFLLTNKNRLWHSYVALNIISPDYSGRVVIRGDQLGYYFVHYEKLNWWQYKLQIAQLIASDDTLKVSINIENTVFRKVGKFPIVEEEAKKGKEHFLNFFFDDECAFRYELRLGDYYTDYAIIDQLFKWRILMYNEGYTGTLKYSIEFPPQK